jgi:Family of unknown function (DUF5954)
MVTTSAERPEERSLYAAAADRLDAERPSDLAVAGRRFRVVRVERLVRIGQTGPRGHVRPTPTRSHPVMVQEQRLREQGLPINEGMPTGLDEDARRFA